jgi:DNA polymerase-1
MASPTRQTRLPGLESDEPLQRGEGKVKAKGEVDASEHLQPGLPSGPGRPSGPATQHECGPIPGDDAKAAAGAKPPKTLRGKTVYVIDSHSLIFQVFHALPEMTSPHGEPVGAVFGFTRDLLFLLEQKKPDYLFAAFDMPGATYRHEMFAAYKEHRTEMPDDLATQIPAIKRVLDVLEIPVLGVSGYEADDVLATVARITSEKGGECLLVTGDKDCRQLIGERVKIFNVRKNQMFDAAALAADWGVRPEQVVDYQALVGDPVDNIPGVPLIGPKLARELLEKFGSVEGIYEHIDEVAGGKRKENLTLGREQAFLSRELARLNVETPVAIDWERGRAGNYDPAKAADLFAEFGFHALTQQMRSRIPPTRVAWKADYQTIDTPERLAALVAEMSRQPVISIDTETTSTQPRWAEIVGYSFSWGEGQGYYLPVRAPAGAARLDAAEALAALRPVLENPQIRKIGQNLKYDLIVLRSVGVEVAGVEFDTMVASYLLDAGERNHNLDELAARYLNHSTTTIDELIGTGKQQKRMDEVPVPLITHYAAEDADVVWRLQPLLAKRLEEAKLDRLFREVEIPFIEVLVELEHNGIKVDVQRLADLSCQYGEKLVALEREIYDVAGHKFNIGSPKQLQEVLFDELKLPKLKKTKTGASTDADVLEELARVHPLPAKIIEYRQYAKLKGTYVDALPALVHPATGRVHASFNQSVAATGRLSSSDPNLQNIPIRTEVGREIRSAFLPGYEGWRLVAADYSQIELRMLAHLSGDVALREAFARDEDIHARVASQVYNVPLADVSSEMRRVAKAVNFGVIYGQSPFGLSKMLGIEKSEAAKFIQAYFAGHPGVSEFLERIIADCRRNGYVTTILGRRRTIRGLEGGKTSGNDVVAAIDDALDSPSPLTGEGRGEGKATVVNSPSASTSVLRQRSLAERTAINTVVQGSATADLIKLAMINIHRRLKSERLASRMLLQIHDELIFESPPDETDRLVALIKAEMSGVLSLAVPLKIDVKTGLNWAECEPWA